MSEQEEAALHRKGSAGRVQLQLYHEEVSAVPGKCLKKHLEALSLSSATYFHLKVQNQRFSPVSSFSFTVCVKNWYNFASIAM